MITPSRIDEMLRYELKVAQNVKSILGQQVGVRNSRVLKGPSLRTDPDLDRQVESAEAIATITEHERDELLLLDLIVSGARTGSREKFKPGSRSPSPPMTTT